MSIFTKIGKHKREAREEAKKNKEEAKKKIEEEKQKRKEAWEKSFSLYFVNEDNPSFYNDILTSEKDVTERYNALNRSRRFMVNSWSNERIGKDMFPVHEVQKLWNMSVSLFRKLSWMKREAIKRGVARYNPSTGDFEWLDVNTSKDPEKDID